MLHWIRKILKMSIRLSMENQILNLPEYDSEMQTIQLKIVSYYKQIQSIDL